MRKRTRRGATLLIDGVPVLVDSSGVVSESDLRILSDFAHDLKAAGEIRDAVRDGTADALARVSVKP